MRGAAKHTVLSLHTIQQNHRHSPLSHDRGYGNRQKGTSTPHDGEMHQHVSKE